jgi:alcohol dehydrogenase
MIDFDFVNPTRIVFGRKSEDKIGAICSSYGYKRVLLVYGGGSIKVSGLYDKVISSLDAAGIFHAELSGVRPNPDRSSVIRGIALAKRNEADSLLAVGGGSAIDVAKAIGAGFYYAGDPFDFNLRKAVPTKSLPLGVILTIASSGSESSDSCVISDDSAHVKQGFNNNLVRPIFAIEDPELTYTVSSYQTAVGIADIMMHSLERYFSPSGEYQLSDDWALSLAKNVMAAGKAALANPNDYEARAALMLASSLSHDGLTAIGKKTQFVVHPLEHAISGYKSTIAHGAGVAVVWLGWARFASRLYPEKFARLGRVLFDLNISNDEKAAIMSIVAMKEFYSSIGLPTSLQEFGLTEKDIPILANLASGNGTHVIGCCPRSLERQDMEAIYSMCLK